MHTTKRIVAILTLGALIASACGGGGSDLAWEDHDRTYTSVPDRDGYIWKSGFLHTSARLYAGDNDGLIDADAISSVLCFDTGGIGDGAVIESAVLRVYQEDHQGSPYSKIGNLVVDHVTIGADVSLDDYDGGNITANIGTLSTTAVEEWKTLDVTAAVQNDVTANRPRSEFRIRFSTESNDDNVSDFVIANDGEDSEGTGNLPQLVVSYRSPRL